MTKAAESSCPGKSFCYSEAFCCCCWSPAGPIVGPFWWCPGSHVTRAPHVTRGSSAAWKAGALLINKPGGAHWAAAYFLGSGSGGF